MPLDSNQKFSLNNTCEWAGQLPRCVFGSWIDACSRDESVWAEHGAGGVFRWAALSYPLHQPDLTGSQWSENKETGTGGPLNDGWHCWEPWRLMLSHVGSSKEMFLQVCLRSLPSPFQASVVVFRHHRFSLKRDSKLRSCECSFIKVRYYDKRKICLILYDIQI